MRITIISRPQGMLQPAGSGGAADIYPAWLTPDGRRYAYSYRRCLSDLYLVTKASR